MTWDIAVDPIDVSALASISTSWDEKQESFRSIMRAHGRPTFDKQNKYFFEEIGLSPTIYGIYVANNTNKRIRMTLNCVHRVTEHFGPVRASQERIALEEGLNAGVRWPRVCLETVRGAYGCGCAALDHR